MGNTLVAPAELEAFLGVQLSDEVVDIAVAQLRNEAGWHIAPLVTETLEVFSFGDSDLRIPSMRIVSVTEVRFGDVIYTAGWTAYRSSIYRAAGWPVGLLEVDIVHGYVDTPLELLPLIAARASKATDPRDPSLKARTVTKGPFTDSETYRDGVAATATDPVLSRYTLPPGVA